MNTELREGINWVGYVDWEVRDFHGYRTERGSTYNSYLFQDEKTAVIDSVKAPYAAQWEKHVRAFTELDKIDYVVCNHAEPDHAGSIPHMMKICPQATLVCDEKCRKALGQHFNTEGWKFQVVKSGDVLSLGKRTLTFLETPMVHWPESMFSYCPEEKVLFSMDAFGQHYASSHRFDDEEPYSVIMEELKTYFANIVMLYDKPIQRVLAKAADLDIQMIAPSHGVIWRKNIAEVISHYHDWVNHRNHKKVLVLYDTMWKSTAKMAAAILEGVQESSEVDAKLYNIKESSHTLLVTEVLDAAGVAVGSPTLNMTLLPSVAGLLTYLKGLRPAGKAGFAFGSYGWARGGAAAVESYLKEMKVDLLCEPVQAQFVPDDEALERCREAGRLLAKAAIERGEDG